MAAESLTLYRGAATDAETFYAIGFFDDLEQPGEPFPRMRLVKFSRSTQQWEILRTQDWSAAAVAAWQGADDVTKLAVFSTDGTVLRGPSDDLQSEIIAPSETIRINGGAGFDSAIAAVGAASAGYLRAPDGTWQSIISGLSFGTILERSKGVGRAEDYPSIADYMAVLDKVMEGYETFNGISGADPSSLLTVGDNGRLAYWNGVSFDPVPHESKVNFAHVTSTGDGWITIGSNPSTSIVYVDGATRAVTPLLTQETRRVLTGVAFYQDTVLVSGLAPLSGGVFALRDQGLVPFGRFSGNIWALQSTADGLWVLGEKELSFVDDSGTQTFASPYL